VDSRKSIVGDAFRFGLRTLAKHIILFLFILLTVAIVNRVVSIAFTLLYVQMSSWFIDQWFIVYTRCFFVFYALVMFLLIGGMYLGFYKIALDLYDRGKSSIKNLFLCFTRAPRFLVALILYLAMLCAGAVFFVLPGIFVIIRFSLFPYFIVDHNAGAIESLKMSYEVTQNHGRDSFLLSILVLIIVTFLEILFALFGVTGLVNSMGSTFFSVLAYAFFYRLLVPKANTSGDVL